MLMIWKGKRIGLALGGGGARGIAHIGVLKVFHDEAIPVDLIVGTSIGALVGGAYASGTSPVDLEAAFSRYLSSPEFQSSAIKAMEAVYEKDSVGLVKKIRSFLKNRYYVLQATLRTGLLSNEDFQTIINYFIPDISIEETRIPFRAVATDLVSGKLVVLSSGSLRQAVMASCAVPGAIAPLKEGEWLLSDGGIICVVPISIARKEGADFVIAVAVERDAYLGEEFPTAKDVYLRACEIMTDQLTNYELMGADVVIRPEVGDLHWSDFSQATNLIEEGEKAAREHLEEIRSAMPRIRKWFRSKSILRSRR